MFNVLSRHGLDTLKRIEAAGWTLIDLKETSIGWKATITRHARAITLTASTADRAVDELDAATRGASLENKSNDEKR